jgi:hypothetical protein
MIVASIVGEQREPQHSGHRELMGAVELVLRRATTGEESFKPLIIGLLITSSFPVD